MAEYKLQNAAGGTILLKRVLTGQVIKTFGMNQEWEASNVLDRLNNQPTPTEVIESFLNHYGFKLVDVIKDLKASPCEDTYQMFSYAGAIRDFCSQVDILYLLAWCKQTYKQEYRKV